MQDRDWTGTAAAIAALAMTAGVWLWPTAEHGPAPVRDNATVATDDDMARWRAEARRWDSPQQPAAVQISAATSTDLTSR